MSELAPQLSLVTSEEYRQWKSDTLATQSHITEICQEQETAEKTKVSSPGHGLSLYFEDILSGSDPSPR